MLTVGGELASLLAFSYSHSLSVHYDIYCMAILQSDWSRGCHYTRIYIHVHVILLDGVEPIVS